MMRRGGRNAQDGGKVRAILGEACGYASDDVKQRLRVASKFWVDGSELFDKKLVYWEAVDAYRAVCTDGACDECWFLDEWLVMAGTKERGMLTFVPKTLIQSSNHGELEICCSSARTWLWYSRR